jgi:hypothetical protein
MKQRLACDQLSTREQVARYHRIMSKSWSPTVPLDSSTECKRALVLAFAYALVAMALFVDAEASGFVVVSSVCSGEQQCRRRQQRRNRSQHRWCQPRHPQRRKTMYRAHGRFQRCNALLAYNEKKTEFGNFVFVNDVSLLAITS